MRHLCGALLVGGGHSPHFYNEQIFSEIDCILR